MAELGDERAAEVVIDSTVDPSGAAVIALSGELDSSNVGSLEAALQAVPPDRRRRLIFELGGLRFMDSAGIAVLVTAAQGASVQLRHPSDIVRRVVEITGLSELLGMEA